MEKLYNKKSWLFIARKIGRLINESAFVSLKYVTRQPLIVLMKVQQNRNAIVSTDFVSI